MSVRSNSSGVIRAFKTLAVAIPQYTEREVVFASKVAELSAKNTKSWKDGADTNPDGSNARKGKGKHTRDTLKAGVYASGFKGYVEGRGASKFLQYGTAPHIITPSKKRFLRFWSGGVGPIFSKMVFHPGTHPTYFLTEAAEAAINYLRVSLPRVVRDSARFYGL